MGKILVEPKDCSMSELMSDPKLVRESCTDERFLRRVFMAGLSLPIGWKQAPIMRGVHLAELNTGCEFESNVTPLFSKRDGHRHVGDPYHLFLVPQGFLCWSREVALLHTVTFPICWNFKWLFFWRLLCIFVLYKNTFLYFKEFWEPKILVPRDFFDIFNVQDNWTGMSKWAFLGPTMLLRATLVNKNLEGCQTKKVVFSQTLIFKWLFLPK